MEMRKFIVEIHPDGRVYATEYQDAMEAAKVVVETEKKRAYKSGYRDAVQDMEHWYRTH